MSTTFAGSSGRSQKATCSKCKRTVHVVVIDGVKIETDTELITVIPFEEKPARKIMARRSHAEMCVKYQSDAARTAALQLAKRERSGPPPKIVWVDLATKAVVKMPLKKPLPGKREPGQ